MGFEEEPLVRWTRAMTITMTLILVLLSLLPKTHLQAAPTTSDAASQDLDESYDDFEDARTILKKAQSQHTGSIAAAKHHDWDYVSPKEWGKSHKACDGFRQSPIVINPNSAVFQPYPKFQFNLYNRIYPMIINNNGHSAVIHLPPELPSNLVPSISGGGLVDEYLFAQLHFHWGNSTMGGSEHVIGPYRYPAEMHLVHFKAKYKNLTEAIHHEDGLAVLGVFMERETGSNNIPFRHFMDLFDQIQTEGPKVNLPTPIYLMDLLPDDVDHFYRYSGSLTTPGCQESVTWTVFNTPITISTLQYEKFLTLLQEGGKIMTNNFRPPAALYDRIVTYRSERKQPLRPPIKSQQLTNSNNNGGCSSSNRLNSIDLDSRPSKLVAASSVIQPIISIFSSNRPSTNNNIISFVTAAPAVNPRPVPPVILKNPFIHAAGNNRADLLRFRNGAQGFPLPGRR